MRRFLVILQLVLMVAMMTACGKGGGSQSPPVDVPVSDGSIVRGRAYLIVNSDGTIDYYDETAYTKKFLLNLLISSAYAATASVPITYVNAAAVQYTITPSFGSPTLTGDELDLGTIGLATIDDNSLKVCGAGGNTKCTKAIIRLYTTGTSAGFIHSTDGYSVPVLSGGNEIGLGAANAVIVQQVTIASNKNRLRLSDFPAPTYPVKADMSNAGAGSYSMTLVMEYVLAL